MKKLIIVIAAILILCLTLTGFASEKVFDFRKTTWGMSEEQVRVTEKGKIVDEDISEVKTIVYKTNIDAKDFYIAYMFIEDKFYRGGYLLNENYTNENDYIDVYKDLKETLTKKYGKPIKDEINWKDDTYKDDKNNWGLAIGIGELEYISTWETSTTGIELELNGNNYDVNVGVRYMSKELKEWAHKIIEEKTKSNF